MLVQILGFIRNTVCEQQPLGSSSSDANYCEDRVITGAKGEGFAGTMIKFTWAITRWVEAREGGGEGWVERGGGKRQKTVC